MNETIFLGNRRVVGFGGTGLGDVGDLLAYRQEWQPFILAHRDLWRYLNGLFENVDATKQCPTGIFDATQIQNLSSNPSLQSFCAALALTRMYSSDTNPLGIITQWNAWAGKSSAEILAGADVMLKWHQDVVTRVGSTYKDDLLKVAKIWGIDIQLPDVPSFGTQQEIIARIEGAYITTKGILQIAGYGIGETIMLAANVTQATAEGLTEAAKQIPKTTRWLGVAAVVTAVVVGGALLVYYHPKHQAA